MYRYISSLLLALLSLRFATAAVLVERQGATSTYTHTKDTIVKPTANARYQVGVPIDVVWYIPETRFNQNKAESFNITIALGGQVAMELSNSVSFPGYGEHETTFTPRASWPESSKYQIFIFMDFGTKTLTSPSFGIWGGGKTPTPTPDDTETSSTRTSQASRTSPPSATTGGSESSPTSDSDPGPTTSSSASGPSPTTSVEPAPSSGVSGAVLGGAIGGSIAGTLAIVGLIWFMRRSMAQSRASHGANGPNNPNPANSKAPPSYPNNSGNGQQWPYQQMGAPSTTSVNNANSEFKGFAPPPPPPPVPTSTMSEMPTQMHHEPVELHSMPQHNAAAEMPGDTAWNMPPAAPVAQQQPQRYVYSPQSYGQ
ncbi:hypothetical protein TWF730_001771 [Orbilia blumenaviensis]|uniref:Uncharacterized protein n=1 Tax=Orbilia blumenaviensis TaxID=1796055 RepID=A0AAV9UBZ2_9PEZI